MKRVAILQSNYIPWKGYFDLMASVDEFIIYDDVQFTRRDWRNRNKIKTPNGLQWLTIPVKSKGKYDQSIEDTEIDGTDWAAKHWKSVELNYRKAPYFEEVATFLEPLIAMPEAMLSTNNERILRAIAQWLAIETRITRSSQYGGEGVKTDRLLAICQAAGADTYVSGPAAKVYFENEKFEAAEIGVDWFEYGGYEPYDQLWGDFEHYVSIVDLMFNCGQNSPRYFRPMEQ